MSGAHADVSKHVGAYYKVFGALAVFTVITVAVSFLHLATPMAIGVALLIASIKASLVAAIFMHLKWERGLSIWITLAFCGVFFLVLIFVPVLTTRDLPKRAGDPVRRYEGTWDMLPAAEHPAASSSHAH